MTTRAWLLLLVFTGCGEGAGGADGGKPAPSFDPSPEGATRIEQGAVLTPSRVLLAGVDVANFERKGGQLFLSMRAALWHIVTVCSDSGCITMWATEPADFCWKVDGTAATESTGCSPPDDVRKTHPRPEEQGPLYSALRTFSGSRRPTSTLNGGVLLSGSVDAGTYELLGGAQLEVPAAEEFSSWVKPDVVRSSPVHYRLSVRDGGLSGPPLLQRSPDEVPLMDGMMAFFDEGTLRLTWRNRDDTVFGVDPAAPALAGRMLGNGVFGLGWNAAFFPPGAHTGGAAVLGGEWLGLFVTPSYESTDDHGNAAGGGPLQNLWLRRAPIEGTASFPLTHFTGLEATTASSESVDVCFNRQLDPASVASASISVEGLEVKRWALLPGGQCLVVQTSQQSRSQSYAVHVAGLRSLEGEAQVGAGQRLSFYPDEAPVTDLLRAFTGARPATLDGLDAVFLPLKTGAVLVHPGAAQPFQEGGGYFLTGADARSLVDLSSRYQAEGLTVARVHPAPMGGAAWLELSSTRPGLVFLDGAREQVFTSLTHPTLSFERPQVLGDGSAALRQLDGTWRRLTQDGAVEPFLGPGVQSGITGVVWGSREVLVNATELSANRLDADGGVLGNVDFTGLSTFLPPGMTVFELGAETLLCAPSAGLFRVEASPARMTRLAPNCTDPVVAPDGSLWLRALRVFNPEIEAYRYAQGQLKPHVVADPVYGLNRGGWLVRPMRLGEVVFAWAVGVPDSQDFPASLRVMSAADFAALPVEDAP